MAEEFLPYVEEIAQKLKAHGIRVEIDDSTDRFPKKIRNASKSKVPYTLIAGGEDRDAGQCRLGSATVHRKTAFPSTRQLNVLWKRSKPRHRCKP